MIENPHYDVIIVGAGPAGSVLAYELARKSINVLVLEKSKLPRHKVCAGGITVRAAAILPPVVESVFERAIYGARLSYRQVARRVRTYDKPIIYMVMRDRLDSLLASRAREAGSVLLENTEVKSVEINKDVVRVKTDAGIFSSLVLAGADGANGVVVRSLGLQKGFEYGVGINVDIGVKPDELSRWENLVGLDYGVPGGYSWVFPKSGCLSIGSGGPLRVAGRLRPYVQGFMKSYGLTDIDSRVMRGQLMPVRKGTAPISRDRVLLVGDAAGLIDPLTGEGIYYAVRSSHLAVPAILRLLKGQTGDLSEYDESVNLEFGQEFKIARALWQMNSLVPHLFFHWLKDNDQFWRAFCRLLRGEMTYTSLKTRLSPPLQLLFR